VGPPLPTLPPTWRQEAVRLFLGFLEEEGYGKSLKALEEESGVNGSDDGTDLSFLRKLVMGGEWRQCERFLEPLAERSPADGKRAMFLLGRQRFLELLESQAESPNVEALVDALEALEEFCTKEEYNELCYVMTLTRLQKHSRYARWTPHRGRLTCLHELAGLLRDAYPRSPGAFANGGAGASDAPSSSEALQRMMQEALAFRVLTASLPDSAIAAVHAVHAEPVPPSPDKMTNGEADSDAPLPPRPASSHGRIGGDSAGADGGAGPLLASTLGPMAVGTNNNGRASIATSPTAAAPAPTPAPAPAPAPALGVTMSASSIGPGGAAAAYHDFEASAEAGFVCWDLLKDTHPIRALAFSPTGEHLAVGSNSRTLRVCNLGYERAGKVVLERKALHQGSIYCCAWSASEALLATGGNDQTVQLLRLRRGGGCSGLLCEASLLTLTGHNGTVRDVCFSPIADVLVSGAAGDCLLRIWDCERGLSLASLKGHAAPVVAVRPSADGRCIVSAATDGDVRVWDPRVPKCVRSFHACDPGVNGLAVDAAGETLAVAHADGSVRVLDAGSGREVHALALHTGECRSVDYAPAHGRWLLSAGFDGGVCVGDGVTGATVGAFRRHANRVVQARWCPSFLRFASSGTDNLVKLWTPKTAGAPIPLSTNH